MAKKAAYLTIDDAPSRDFKGKVDYLLAKRIPAVFFCRGELLRKRPKDAIYAIKRGFVIGNHSYDHPYFSDLTLKQCFLQIERTDKIIDSLYKQAGIERPAKFFRFPFGDKGGMRHDSGLEAYVGRGKARKDSIQVFLKKLGYGQPRFRGIKYKYYRKAGLLSDADIYWTYDAREWSSAFRNNLKGVFARMDENVPEKGRGLDFSGSEEIILIHDFERTASMFMPIIERLLSKGIIFKSLLKK